MKRFILNIVLFSIVLLISYYLIYKLIDEHLNSKFNKNDVVFVWGDSQAYHGINTIELSNNLKKTVYSSAHRGAGVYDFLIFTQQVPKNSIVVISLSKLVQIRRKEMDYNESGLSYYALKKLYDNNYSTKEVISIFKANLKPKSNITKKNRLLPYRDSMKIELPISHFESYYNKIPLFLNDKQNIYLEGIANLISKNCVISFLEFPYHPILDKIEAQSPINKKTEEFKQKVASLFYEFTTDSIILTKDQNVFNDLSHLNSLGAKDLSKKLGVKMKNNERTTLYIVH